MYTLDEIKNRTLDNVDKLHNHRLITDDTYKQFCTLWRNSTFRFSNLCQEHERPVTGVVHNLKPEWLYEDILYSSICLTFAEHEADCPNDDHDMCWEAVGNEDCLIGFIECEPTDPDAWYGYTGEFGEFGYKLDPDASYSAISRETYTQVVRSTHVQPCHKCSPCYPGQGDLDTPGDYYLAYTLPPDVWGSSVPDSVKEK